MNRETGILVVNRLAFLRQIEQRTSRALRSSLPNMSSEDIFRRYRGFDGLAWPERERAKLSSEEGLALPSEFDLVVEYISRLSLPGEAEAILLAREEMGGAVANGWSCYGFDAGYFESAWSHFSIVLNEVLFGVIPEMRNFASSLNSHLLLASSGAAHDLLRERARLERSGADVERGGPDPEVIAIYGRGVRH